MQWGIKVAEGLRWLAAGVGGGCDCGMGVAALSLPVWLKSEPLGLILNILNISACGSFEFSAPGLESWVFEPL